MTKPKKYPHHWTDKELENSPRRAQELRYLRAENAYLKKLKALVQSEKMAKAVIISELRHEHALRPSAGGRYVPAWYYNMNALKQRGQVCGS